METASLTEQLRREPPHLEVVQELIKTDRTLSGMVEVRKALLFGNLRAHAVTSPISLLELQEWHAETAFRNIAADAVGAHAIQRMGKKNVGEILSRILQGRRLEIQDGVVGPMGMADIMHLLVAKHLGCSWVATFDSDFTRCREHIHDELGL